MLNRHVIVVILTARPNGTTSLPQVDWKVSMKPPRLGRGPGSTTGLGALLTSDDDMDACSAAAQAAMSAARLAGYKSSTSGMLAAHDVIPCCCLADPALPYLCPSNSEHI